MCLPVKPYKVEREWVHAGLKCAVVVARHRGGHRCGYVRVPPGHPYHGKAYSGFDVDVHGGLTFGAIEPCAHEDGTGFWFGFDCHHGCDASIDPTLRLEDVEPEHRERVACRLKINVEFPEMAYDGSPAHYWTHDEVVAETESLARQLAERTKPATEPAGEEGE